MSTVLEKALHLLLLDSLHYKEVHATLTVLYITHCMLTAATAPMSVSVTNTSSSVLAITWDVPLCDNGVRTGYMVSIKCILMKINNYLDNI